jgi:hypothetical protein
LENALLDRMVSMLRTVFPRDGNGKLDLDKIGTHDESEAS